MHIACQGRARASAEGLTQRAERRARVTKGPFLPRPSRPVSPRGIGYSEAELLEKWSRDSKILDIFEGTQQIQQLIVARRVLGLSSGELK